MDLPPRRVDALHRSVSLDHIIVLKRSVVLFLVDGPKTILNQREFIIQQATNQAWHNETIKWARMLDIMLPATYPAAVPGYILLPLEVNRT